MEYVYIIIFCTFYIYIHIYTCMHVYTVEYFSAQKKAKCCRLWPHARTWKYYAKWNVRWRKTNITWFYWYVGYQKTNIQTAFMGHCPVSVKGLHNSMKLWGMPCRATQDGWVTAKSSDKVWSTGGGNGNPLRHSCRENPINSIKNPNKQKIKWGNYSRQKQTHRYRAQSRSYKVGQGGRENERHGFAGSVIWWLMETKFWIVSTL